MDPENGLLIVVKRRAIKLLIILVGQVVRAAVPERIRFIDRNFLRLLVRRSLLLRALEQLFGHFLVGLLLRLARSGLRQILVRVLQIDLDGHERAVLLQDFPRAVLVAELHAVLVHVQRNGRADFRAVGTAHLEGLSAVGLPEHGRLRRIPGLRLDRDAVGDHESRIKAEAEVTDDLVFVRLIFIGIQERLRAGKRDAVNVLFDLGSAHAEAVVADRDRALVRADGDVDAGLIIRRQFGLAHQFQLFQLRDGVAAVRDQLAVKDIAVAVEPLFNDREHVLAVNAEVPLFNDFGHGDAPSF